MLDIDEAVYTNVALSVFLAAFCFRTDFFNSTKRKEFSRFILSQHKY